MKNFTALIVLLAFIGSCKDEKKQVAYSPFSYKIFFGDTEAGYFKSSKMIMGLSNLYLNLMIEVVVLIWKKPFI